MLISTDKNMRCQNSEDHCVLNCANYVLVAGSFEYGNSISAYTKGRSLYNCQEGLLLLSYSLHGSECTDSVLNLCVHEGH